MQIFQTVAIRLGWRQNKNAHCQGSVFCMRVDEAKVVLKCLVIRTLRFYSFTSLSLTITSEAQSEM